MRGDEWQFYTALFDEGGLYVELHHLWRHHHAKGLNDYHQIHLRYSNSNSSEYELLLDTIAISVFDLEGNIVNEIKPASVHKVGGAIYFYPLKMPSNVVEVVKFKVKNNNGVKEISLKLPVKSKFNYTYWSVIMSV